MKKPQPPAATILTWLRNNGLSLAPLTSTDTKALLASVQIIDLLCHAGRDPDLLKAYAAVVNQMQEHTRHLAFHAIAHVWDWSYRRSVWIDSGLAGPKFDQFPTTRCNFE